jgi:hypothetical protein
MLHENPSIVCKDFNSFPVNTVTSAARAVIHNY